MKYYALRCKNCGRYSAKMCREDQRLQDLRFKCFYCRKSTKLKHKGEFGIHLKHYGPYDSTVVSKVVSKLNK